MREIKLTRINDSILSDIDKFIRESDLRYEEQIEITADSIAYRKDECPLVFVAGPRGSGKKISARKIRYELEKQGIRTFLITLDNYLMNNNPNEISDFENPLRINKQAFDADMSKIVEGKPIYVTSYSKEQSGYTIGGEVDFKKGDVLIVEGLQALNPEVTDSWDDYARYVYTSIRTRVVSEQGTRLHPSKLRLLRRLVRAMYNGKPIEKILDAFDETQLREDRYVMPYKYRANYEIDTFIGYEASAYKPLILPKLEELSKTYDLREKFGDLMHFLGDVETMPIEAVPENSMIHEFMEGIK